MIRPFLWCCFLGVAVGLSNDYGLPSAEIIRGVQRHSSDGQLPHLAAPPSLENDQKESVADLLTFPQNQRQEENEEVVTADEEQNDEVPSGEEPIPAEQYGLPSEGDFLQKSYSEGAHQQKDESAVTQSNNLNESPQLLRDNVVPYPVLHNLPNYAPHHQINYVADTRKYYSPQQQYSPEQPLTSYQLESYTKNHREPKYPLPVVQARVQEPVLTSAPHQIYEVPEVYQNQRDYAKYDSSYQTQVTERSQYQVPTNDRKSQNRYTNYRAPTTYLNSPLHSSAVTKSEIPVRLIAVFQKFRAPGKSDVATSSYFSQRLQNDEQAVQTGAERTGNPLVLPISTNFLRSSPIGSISSTFISKDVRPTSGNRQSVRQDVNEGSDVSTQFNRQNTYGLPDF